MRNIYSENTFNFIIIENMMSMVRGGNRPIEKFDQCCLGDTSFGLGVESLLVYHYYVVLTFFKDCIKDILT